MLKINIDEIGSGLNFKESIPAKAMPELNEMQAAGELVFNAPLAFELYLERVENVINITGVLHGEAVMNCGRCLSEYPHKFESSFALKAAPKATERRYEKETELLETELDDFTYDGNTLDLREILQEQVILALPIAPLCRTNCRGLCPTCGQDLNERSCGCEAKQGHPAFAGLKDLF